jgi:hypothetical protein
MIFVRVEIGDHPREHGLPRRLRNRHARHEKDRPGEQLDAISRNRVAFRVARLDKHGLPRETHRLFAPCPRHSLHARRAIHGPGGLFLMGLGILPLLIQAQPSLPRRAVFCAAFCRGPAW